MRALTLWQPMAWAISEGYKPVENRVWRLGERFIGQRFAVHAGKKYDEPWAESIRSTFGLEVPSRADIPLGAVVAVATFAGCVDELQCGALTRGSLDCLGVTAPPEAIRRWFSGPYGFLVHRVHKLSEPVPCRGAQGLWNLPPDIEQLVLERETLEPVGPIPVSSAPAAANRAPGEPVQSDLFAGPADDDIPY